MKFDLFVDESCHLENDHASVMCIGYVKVPSLVYSELKEKLKAIKETHCVENEIKWSRFSKARLELYKSLVDCFFDSPLEFRCVLVKYKGRLNHEDFNQGSHDNFYYKMTYYLLRPNPLGSKYRVFMDIKDTRGREKLRKITEVFENYHRGESPFEQFQHLPSHDNLFFQLTDLFIGAITYKCRLLAGEVPKNVAKEAFVDYVEEKSGYSLHEGTSVFETKFNIFNHQPKSRA